MALTSLLSHKPPQIGRFFCSLFSLVRAVFEPPPRDARIRALVRPSERLPKINKKFGIFLAALRAFRGFSQFGANGRLSKSPFFGVKKLRISGRAGSGGGGKRAASFLRFATFWMGSEGLSRPVSDAYPSVLTKFLTSGFPARLFGGLFRPVLSSLERRFCAV